MTRLVFRAGAIGLLALALALLSLLALWPSLPLLDGVSGAHLLLDREGRFLRLGLSPDEKYRLIIPLDAVPPQAVEALLLYEDRHFYRHCGVNPLAMLRAAGTWLLGGRRSGASTITMQVARLRFNLPSGSWTGKLRQIWLALRLERHYSKQDILEAYFNLAPYGGNIEGLEAAARVYFHKAAARLTSAEILALTVVPQNPSRRHPLKGRDFDAARTRLLRLWQDEHGQDAAAFADAPLRLFTPADLPFEAPHVCAEILDSQPPGLIRCALSLPEQRLLEGCLSRFAARSRAYGLSNAAALLVHAPTREIRALAGSADFLDEAIAGQVDGSRAKRSPGSTLKPFIYALALDQGLIHPRSLLIDSPRSFGGYDPKNFDQAFRGPLSADEALRASRNLPAIILAQRLKEPDLYDFLQRAGLALPRPREHYGLSLVLGGAETSMRELAALYALLVNGGLSAPLRLFPSGSPLAADPAPRRLLSREAAFVTLDMLKREDIRLASLSPRLKTGTSNGFRDAWTAGVLGEYILVVWVGNFDNQPNPLLVGAEVAQPLFMDIAGALAARLDLRDNQLDRPDPALNLQRVRVCSATGDLDTRLCPGTVETWFIPGVSPLRDSGVYREILLDKASGLRACVADPETTELAVREFWPGDLRRIFAQAGLEKPAPPDWLPQCRPENPDAAGSPPVILSPRAGLVYYTRLSAPDKNGIPLSAGIGPGGTRLFWFLDDSFIGESAPDETLVWHARPGKYELRCTDDLGRSARRTLEVRVAR